jgi:hypothetical protein
MELAKLLIKLVYLILVYGIINLIMKFNTPLAGGKLVLISFLVSVLFMYFTFDYVYDVLINNEIVFKSSNDNTQNNDNSNSKSRTYYSSDNSLNVDDESTSYNKYTMNHNHKYIIDQVFD